jgi:hypothetical protein
MVSAFIKFSQAKRGEILAANPGAGFGEVGKLLGAAWRALSDAEKASYASAGPTKTRKTRKNKGTHRTKKPVYGEEDLLEGPTLRMNKGRKYNNSTNKPNNNNKPNKPNNTNKTNKTKKTKKIGAYAMFVKDHQAEVKAQNPGASFGEISKKIAAMWQAQK